MKKYMNKTAVVVLGTIVLAMANAGAQTSGFQIIPDSYSVQHPYNLPVSDRFSANNGVYTCWVYGTDAPLKQGSTTGPRTEMRWETWPNQGVANQLVFDEMFSTGTSHTCVHQIKSDNKGDGSGGEALYLQVNEAGTLRNGEGADFATGIGGTWYHINSIYDPATGNAELYYNGSEVVNNSGYTWPNGNWYFKTGVYDNGMPTNAEAWVQIKNVVHWQQVSGGGGLSGTYQIQSVASGLALNVSGNATTNGAPVIQWPYGGGSANAKWTFVATDSGYYQIKNVNSGLDAVVQGASTSDGAKIIQWSFGSAQNDQWLPQQNSDGTYTFVNRKSGMVLDDPGSSTSQGTQMDQWSSNGGSNQKWNLISE